MIPAAPSEADSGRYIVMGDKRDGYDTFDAIIAQINALDPIFVIDNGDLVFSGKPNQYRLFDQSAANISATLCLTLGNHDIRQNGRSLYTKLYGPAYYSFDFGDNHFVFLDSSPGWTQKQAISDEQYAWLERDLQKAQGKNIYVVTHIPPTDPRAGVTPNELPAYMDQLKNDQGAIENLLDRYEANENIDHGFQDRQEAARFENLMTEYHVNTVYLSHIHSYFDFTKNNVRYIISGGAGAELLTENSYYHFLIAKLGDPTITIVELPSPANTLVARYSATAALFAKAMYRENRMAATFFLIGVGLFVLLLLTLIVLRLRRSKLWILVRDTGKSAGKRFKELYPKKKRG